MSSYSLHIIFKKENEKTQTLPSFLVYMYFLFVVYRSYNRSYKIWLCDLFSSVIYVVHVLLSDSEAPFLFPRQRQQTSGETWPVHEETVRFPECYQVGSCTHLTLSPIPISSVRFPECNKVGTCAVSFPPCTPSTL